MVEDLQATTAPAGSARKRERSTIQFPYGDLDDAVEVVTTIYQRAGNQCTLDQLAAWMGHDTVTSGTFRMKIATARTFGLVDFDRQQALLAPLGRQIVDPQRQPQARVDAFLSVPLYRAIFDRYRGHLLPPDVGLANELINLGVAKKQADKARQAFQRSAEQAGFFKEGRDRLVLPTLPTKPIEPESKKEEESKRNGGGGNGGDLHPFIQGLLQTLPLPGTEWPQDKRKVWLQTAENIFGLIYKDAKP